MASVFSVTLVMGDLDSLPHRDRNLQGQESGMVYEEGGSVIGSKGVERDVMCVCICVCVCPAESSDVEVGIKEE